ncbi:MAG: 16S rRNA (guanine(527)-N(7))-methyltransferase RsmG [Aphanocapsa sp. GSE-SYN-MK-11-07L]|jgi:16S rRNA (guanine527-N7)-methyltransferase|nr:16S rRNA (guanine(527)-N(7))-methyltransferase RsmG [Aphanocapsa sp. GSE-SYN-MK-11-07L]
MSQLPDHFDLWRQTLNWQPTSQQQQQFQRLYELILAGNQRLNLTRITAPEDFWEKHLWDSLSGVAPYLVEPDSARTVIDIGTGGGFPGLPVAIACPNWQVTLLDSTHKKMAFLTDLLPELELQNVSLICDRAEQLHQSAQCQEFDLALVRAVGSGDRCAEFALPLLKPGGLAILYRGQWSETEAESLQSAVPKLGGSIESIQSWLTPLSQSSRTCLYLRKHS